MIRRVVDKLRSFSRSTDPAKGLERAEVMPEDVFIVSYPKSGNTWGRFLFANILKDDPSVIINFHNVHDYCPEWERYDGRTGQPTSPRIFKSHQGFTPVFPNVVYIVRDGRDAYVSYFHYLKKTLPPGWSFLDFLERYDFPYGRWSEHVGSWVTQGAAGGHVLVVRYEDMLKDAFREFSSMTCFAGLKAGQEKIRDAVEKSSFTNMKEIEKRYGRKYRADGTDSFVRKGCSGEWRRYYGRREKEVFLRKENVRLLERFGYESM